MGHLYDEHEVIAALRAIVAEQGESYLYERNKRVGFVCIYWNREVNCPSCLVGHVLARLGCGLVPDYIEGHAVAGILKGTAPDIVQTYFRERFTEPALRVLAFAQDSQDNGETWGEALRQADHAYRLWVALHQWPRLAIEVGE